MFSEEDLSGKEIDIYVKFLPVCNAFNKAVNKFNKERRIAAKNEESTFFIINHSFSLLRKIRLHRSVKEIWEGNN